MDEQNFPVNLGLIATTIKDYLDSNEYNYHYDEKDEIFDMGFTLDNDRVKLRFFFDEEREWFSMVVFPSHAIPVGKVDKILPVINNINRKLLFGNFFVDPEDGELAFRMTASVDNRSINDTMVAVMMSTGLNTIDDHINDIMKALYTE